MWYIVETFATIERYFFVTREREKKKKKKKKNSSGLQWYSRRVSTVSRDRIDIKLSARWNVSTIYLLNNPCQKWSKCIFSKIFKCFAGKKWKGKRIVSKVGEEIKKRISKNDERQRLKRKEKEKEKFDTFGKYSTFGIMENKGARNRGGGLVCSTHLSAFYGLLVDTSLS